MREYLLRRLLLVPVTIFGVTIIVFGLTRVMPGGPVERAVAEAQQAAMGGGRAATTGGAENLSEAQIQELRAYYGLDKPWYIAYFVWLGNLAQGDFGRSFIYGEPVTDVLADKFPISIYYGVVTLIVTYAVCIPLGVVKALRHGRAVDNLSSVLIFIGYAIPGYVLGSLLLYLFAFKLDWFPTGGFVSENFESLSFFGKAGDLVSHSVLPLACYLVSSFAVLTMLMKNNLLDNIAADYVRTAVAKGVGYRMAVLKHALRNSLIPIATTFGQNLTLFVTGSFLIESIFDINGFGLLGLNSIKNRDYPVVMAILLLSSFLLVLGNILSDILVAVTDPRVRFK